MQLRYDEELVEAAAFLCAGGRRADVPPLQIRRFNREREKPYAILDPDQRNAAFFTLHLEWFREWGLEQVLLKLVDEFPLFRKSLTVLAFRKARGRNEEGAELFVSAETGRNAVVALLPERFARDEALVPFLRHEFMHVNDMLDAAFGYSPQLHSAGHNPAQQRLARERYRLLWDITIDGRLTAAKRTTNGSRDSHRALFDRAFGFWSEPRRDEIFASLWDGPKPHHPNLLAIASDPREVKRTHEPLPGATCPLCDFPTFEWSVGETLPAEIRLRIGAEFPSWSPAQGLCKRCRAVYEVAADALASCLLGKENQSMIHIERIFISPGHNFCGHHGQPPGQHAIVEQDQVECVAGRGLRGDRFFDYKDDYKGQITFFSMEVFDALRRELKLPDAQPQATRRNAFVRGADLNALIGHEFAVQGVRFAGVEESKPCDWMEHALGPGAREWLKGRGGLRCRILTDGVLRRDA